MRALFLRGLTREIRHWNGLPEVFEAKLGIPVMTLDLPGAGANSHLTSPSNINEYVEFLRANLPKGESIVLIGISMGGMIALRWAELYPHEVHSVFAINSSAGNLSSPNMRFNLGQLKLILKILTTRNLHQKEKCILNLTTNLLSENSLESLSSDFARFQKEHPVSLKSSLNQLMAASRFEIHSPVKAPVFIISSLADHLVNPNCSEKLGLVLNAKNFVHSEAGHDIPLDAPEWLLSVLANNL